jgi:hypothetical protein
MFCKYCQAEVKVSQYENLGYLITKSVCVNCESTVSKLEEIK